MQSSAVTRPSLPALRRRFPRLGRLADLSHEFVERGVIASGEGAKRIGSLKNSFLDRLRDALGQEQQFFLIGVQGVGEAVDQGVRWIIAEIQPLILDPAQVSEADIDLPGEITEAPILCVSKLSDSFPR